MDTIIAAPASCKVRAVIRFLRREGQSMAEIHHQMCLVYGDIMSDSSEVDPKQTARDAH
jgi:galactokinase/mevalonate kinase-like predicted kinase